MDKRLEASIAAFNVSRNCDRSNSQTFFDSYITRKKLIIKNKLHALERGAPINRKKLEWEIFITELALRNKEGFLKLAEKLIKASPDSIQSYTLERATKLVDAIK